MTKDAVFSIIKTAPEVCASSLFLPTFHKMENIRGDRETIRNRITAIKNVRAKCASEAKQLQFFINKPRNIRVIMNYELRIANCELRIDFSNVFFS